MTSLRWWMMALLMLGSIINYLTRSTLGVAAPTILQDLHITTQQYSWIVGDVPGRDHAAADLRLRPRRRRAEGRVRDVRDRLVVRQHGARPGAQLAGVRGPARAARLRRRLRQPRRHEGDGGVVSRQGARSRRRPLQHRRVGRLDARAAARRVGDSHLQLAGRVRHDRAHRSRVGGAVAGLLPLARSGIATLSAAERDYIVSGQEQHLRGRRDPAVDRDASCASGISGASRCRDFSPTRPGAR